MAYEALEILFRDQVGVVIATKGPVAEPQRELLQKHAALVRIVLELPTLDDEILRVFEPHRRRRQRGWRTCGP